MEVMTAWVRVRVTEVRVGCSVEILTAVWFYLIFTRSCSLLCDTTWARYEDKRYAVRYTVTFGARSYPGRVRDTVTTSAVTSAEYELALGGSRTSNILLPTFFLSILGKQWIFLPLMISLLVSESPQNRIQFSSVINIWSDFSAPNTLNYFIIHKTLAKDNQRATDRYLTGVWQVSDRCHHLIIAQIFSCQQMYFTVCKILPSWCAPAVELSTARWLLVALKY